MKKFALILVLCIVSLVNALAVPSGAYSDSRGRRWVLITDSQEIHLLDKEGKVQYY